MAETETGVQDRIRRLEAERNELSAEIARLRGPPARETPAESQRRGWRRLRTLKQGRRRLLAIRDAVALGRQRLVQLQRQKDELMSIVAHDLRTPLVAIQGFAQLLLSSSKAAPLTDKQNEYVVRILQAVQSMNHLVDDLLTARRLEQGRLPLRPQTVDPRQFLESSLTFHQEAARQKGVDLRLEAAEPLPRCRCDPDRLGQALGNLVQNAVKYTPPGGSVRVRVTAEGQVLQFEVLDQGPGIPDEALDDLFDRYLRGGDSSSGRRDHGLGLYICREVVELHGGETGVENMPEGGSRFWFRIPGASVQEGTNGGAS